MKSIASIVLLGVLVLEGCTTIPDRFAKSESEPDCGHRSEPIAANGFALEVFLKKYSFLPNPDASIVAGRECFTKTAQTLAQKAGKKIVAPTLADMNASATRNIMDGTYSVYVTGKVMFAP